MKDRPTRILIAECIPSLNKGELAILTGMLETFDALGKREVSIFSISPKLDKQRYPEQMRIVDLRTDLYIDGSILEKSDFAMIVFGLLVMLQHVFFSMLYTLIRDRAVRIMKKEIWKVYCRSDVIVMCHDQMSYIFGSWFLCFSPLYITLLAKTLDKPVVIYANGSDDPERAVLKIGLWKILAGYILSNVDLITVREAFTYNQLKDVLWNNVNVFLTADPAILLRSVDHDRIRQIVAREKIPRTGELLIGVTLSHKILLSICQGIKSRRERYKTAVEKMARLLDHFIDNLDSTVVFLPHCIEPYRERDDRDTASDIYDAMNNKDRIVLITREYSPEELKGLVGIFNLLIGGRVHSVISALSMGVPSITLTQSTDRRAYGIIGKMFDQENWIQDVEGLSLEGLIVRVSSLLSIRDVVSRNLVTQTKLVRKRALLNGKLLKALLDS